MVQRQGVGRVRHLHASLLWIQQKEKVLSVALIPTDLNCADIGTKNLAKKRLLGLLFMLKVVNAMSDRVGEEEYEELERNFQVKPKAEQQESFEPAHCCWQIWRRPLQPLWSPMRETAILSCHGQSSALPIC